VSRRRASFLAAGALICAIFVFAVGVPVYRVVESLHFGRAVQESAYSYPNGDAERCRGRAHVATRGQYAGIGYTVRAPSNYDPTWAHSLLVVFAPANYGQWMSERLVGLTHDATGAGFLVAYIESKRLNAGVLQPMGRLAAHLAQRWCVDTERIYYAGHSDGGTLSMAMGFTAGIELPPKAIVVSASGIRGEDLSAYRCPKPTAAMIWHGRDDAVFPLPAYGAEAARWWAACNGCDPKTLLQESPNGCSAFEGCANGGQTIYCEHAGGHRTWPRATREIMEFLSQGSL
jgi:polyhydroxybutyrate depolymerase